MVKSPFSSWKNLDRHQRIILAIALTINLIVLANSFFHHPISGYDSDENLRYIAVLSEHLPDQPESNQFFSPPLPYFLPSIAYNICASFPGAKCIIFGGEVAQFLNVVLSIGITILFLRISDLAQPGNVYFKIGALVFLGIPTVYYKTFSQVRAEPYVAFFTTLLIYFILKILADSRRQTWKYGVILGIVVGLLILSRQWGFLLLPAFVPFLILLYVADRESSLYFGKVIVIALVVGALVGGWFYVHLQQKYGSVTTFNRKTQEFSFANQPPSFYRNTGLGKLLLFRSPTRKTFDNQFFPIFYSETWGDYWGYFTFVREKTLFGKAANQNEITPYLGRVNLASILPSILMAAGVLMGVAHSIGSVRKKSDPDFLISSLFTLMILSSMAGYMWFLITHPLDAKGVTIKATYMIQVFMLVPFLASGFLEKIRARQPRLYTPLMLTLAVIFLHNLPAVITRHWYWLLPA